MPTENSTSDQVGNNNYYGFINDTYIFGNVNGQDAIYDMNGLNTIIWNGVNADDINYVLRGTDLLLTFGNQSICLQNYIGSACNPSFELQLANG